jgi:hypothetical protein
MVNVGLEIRDCTYHLTDKGRWIGLPAKPYTDDEGNTKYSYIVKFLDKEKYAQFQKSALAALDKYGVEQEEETPDADIPF